MSFSVSLETALPKLAEAVVFPVRRIVLDVPLTFFPATLKDFKARGYSCSGVHLPNSYYSVFGEQGVYPGVREFHSHFVALPCGWWFKRCGNE